MQSDSVENIFACAWTLLTRNPVIVVPGIIVGLVVGIVNALIAPHPHLVDGSGTPSGSDVIAVPFLGPIVAAVVSQAVTAYATLVIVGEYFSARNAPDIMPAGPLA